MILNSIIRKFFLSRGYEIQKIDLRKNKYLQCSNWDYQQKVVLPHLPKDGIILDLGSGHHPVPHATILADFFPDDTVHRASAIIEDRPLIICSVDRVPILPKKIDFVICSHIVEHVDSPIRAGRELGRIAKAGYIETPAYGKDIIVGTGNMHKWQIVEFEGAMYFFEYSERQKEAHVTSPPMEMWASKKYYPWQDFFWDRQDLYNAMHLWNGQPIIIEHRRNNSVPDPLPEWVPIDERQLVNKENTLTPAEIELLESCLATPDGSDSMKFKDNGFVNEEKKIRYPVRGKKIYFEMSSDT